PAPVVVSMSGAGPATFSVTPAPGSGVPIASRATTVSVDVIMPSAGREVGLAEIEERSGETAPGGLLQEKTARAARQSLRIGTATYLKCALTSDRGAVESPPPVADLDSSYNPTAVEKRWYPFWQEKGYFRADPDSTKPPFCIVLPPPN